MMGAEGGGYGVKRISRKSGNFSWVNFTIPIKAVCKTPSILKIVHTNAESTKYNEFAQMQIILFLIFIIYWTVPDLGAQLVIFIPFS